MAIIVTEYGIREDGVKLVQRKSDRNVMLVKVGTEEMYSDPIDVENAPWTYAETETPVPVFEEETVE